MAWFQRLLNVLRPRRLSAELDREMEFHLNATVEDLVARGMDPRDAAHEARRRFGNRTARREDTHDVNVLGWLESLFADIRYAVRSLVKSPGFAMVAILSLALGIGANSAIFSLTNAVILKPLPVAQPEQLLQLSMAKPEEDEFTNPLWEQVREATKDYAGSLAVGEAEFNLAKGGLARVVRGEWVSGSFFDVLGVRPVAGRLVQPADDRRGCAGVAVLSGGFAEREYGSAGAAVGRTISLDGHPLEIVGVSDPEFSGLEVGRASDVYVPICAQGIFFSADILDHRSRWFLQVVMRPHDGLTQQQVRARLASVAPGIFEATIPPRFSGGDKAEYVKSGLDVHPGATGFSELRHRYRLALFTLMVVVGVVLLIACANIANLLVARAAARQREFAIRLAVGAGRWRLARQLLTESLILALAGAVLGVLFAQWASGLLVGFISTGNRPVWLDLSLDLRVLGFTVAVAVATAVIFGVAPAWLATRVDPQWALKAGGRGAVGGASRHRFGKAMVVLQVALSLALVAASGLLLGSFRKLVTIDTGFRRDGVLLVTLDYSSAGYQDAQLAVIEREIAGRLRSVPGVSSAARSLLTPIGGMSWNEFVITPTFSPVQREDSLAWFNSVSEGYFATLGTAMISGRDFTSEDVEKRRHVAVVNETLAKRWFAGASPLGRSFRMQGPDTASDPFEVIGVVHDTKYQRLDEKVKPIAYIPLGMEGFPQRESNFAIRTSGAPRALVPAIRSLVTAVNPAISLKVTTLEAQVAGSLARPRLLAALSGFFGALALLLAVIGLYGTMSYNVTRRRNEIGIRLALGAASRQVLGMVVGEAGRLIVAGIALGAAIALAGTRLVASLLYGMTATDPLTFVLAALVLAVVALAAAWLPAWRAGGMDPMEALREE